MPLVLQLAKLSRRLAMVGCAGASLAGVGAATACYDGLPVPPIDPPGDTLPPVDPNDPAFGRSVHFVAPEGAWVNTGSLAAPWNLTTALIGAGGRVTPGDTIWILEGTYRGSFVSTVSGAPGASVLLRSRPGERAVIEHAGDEESTLTVEGDWTTFWGLEVTNLDPKRSAASSASELRPNAIVNNASHTRYINLLVHDAGVGFFTYAHTEDVEVSGSIFYNNGWQGSDRGHGHALYLKSNTGPVRARENVAFNQFGWGVHAYSNQGSGGLNGITIERNILFGNGTLASTAEGENILLGGQATSTGSSVTGNIGWLPRTHPAANLRVGFGSAENGTVDVRDNLLVGGDPVLRVGRWATATFSSNTLAGAARMVQLEDGSLTGYSWSATHQMRDPLSLSWLANGVASPFLLWTTLTGLGANDLVGTAAPTAPTVFVWPNAHEPGRAFVTVMNWTEEPSLTVDLSSVLSPGDAFAIHNVQALFDAPALSGTYSGPVSLPMTGVSPPIPIGLSSSRAPRTGPDFDVFLVIRR
jgi:hypothetical protein